MQGAFFRMENNLIDACNNILSDAKWILMLIGFIICGLCFLSQFGMSVLVDCAKTALKCVVYKTCTALCECLNWLRSKICNALCKCCAYVCPCCGNHAETNFDLLSASEM